MNVEHIEHINMKLLVLKIMVVFSFFLFYEFFFMSVNMILDVASISKRKLPCLILATITILYENILSLYSKYYSKH